jgi:diguanylate cyclase (GGDEF)-like protein
VGVYVTVLAVAAVLVSRTWPQPFELSAAPVQVPWWILSIGFFLTNAFPVSFRVDGEQHNVCLNEVLKVVGLALAGPLALVGSMVLGCTLADGYRTRGGSVLKKLFNVSWTALEASAAVALYHAVLQGGDPVQPIGWLAAFVGAGVTSMCSGVAVATAMHIHGGIAFKTSLPRKVWFSTFLSVSVNVVIGLLAVITMVVDMRAAVLTALLFALAKWGFHSYGGLTEDHEATQQLQELSARIHQGLDDDVSLTELVGQLRMLLSADWAELRLITGAAVPQQWRTITRPGHPPMGFEPAALHRLFEEATRLPDPLHLTPNGAGSARTLLTMIEASEAVIAPVVTNEGPVGMLVIALHRTATATFLPDHLRLLQIIAAHTGTALQNAALIHALKQRVEESEYEASHDSLTGLVNRGRFTELLAQATSGPPGGEVHGVMVVDLDGFKAVNDSVGHDAGDRVLQQSAQRLAKAVRPGDVLARLGGDEFAVLLRGVETRADVLAVAARMQETLRQPVAHDGGRVSVGASIGVALYPADATTSDRLLKHADAAMYVAKRSRTGTHLHDVPALPVA